MSNGVVTQRRDKGTKKWPLDVQELQGAEALVLTKTAIEKNNVPTRQTAQQEGKEWRTNQR